MWDVRSGQEQAPLIGHEHGIFALAFDPTGRELVTAAEDGTCRIWDFETRHQSVLHISLRDLAPDLILQATNYADSAELAFTHATSLDLSEQQAGHRDFYAGGIGAALHDHPGPGRGAMGPAITALKWR